MEKRKYKLTKTLFCLLAAVALSLTSCDRVKEAVGADKIAKGDVALLPADSDTESEVEREPGAASVVSVIETSGEVITETKYDDDRTYYEIGEPVLIEYLRFPGEVAWDDGSGRDPADAEIRMNMQFTVMNVEVMSTISDEIKNALTPCYRVGKGETGTYDINDYIDEDGNLDSDYLFVLVDFNSKYVSGNIEETIDIGHVGTIGIDYNIAYSEKGESIVYDNGITLTTMINYDKYGNVYDPNIISLTPKIANYSVYPEYEGHTAADAKEADKHYMYLELEESVDYRLGVFLKKSLIEEWGATIEFGWKNVIKLDIDLSEYE